MALLTTKTYRIIDMGQSRVKIGTIVRIVRSDGGIAFNGQVSKLSEASLTATGYLDNGRSSSQSFTAQQLHDNDYISFLLTDDLKEIWSEADYDITTDKTVDIFDVTATRKGQFARYTLNGTAWINATVVGISETALSLNASGSGQSITVNQAKSAAFEITFADDLSSGSGSTPMYIFEGGEA